MQGKERDPNDYDHMQKIILVGDTEVGKTHLVSGYVKGTLPKKATPTIGVEFFTKIVPLQNGESVKAQIWDTAGNVRYRTIAQAHYRRAVGALLVYDITKEESFHNANTFVDLLRNHAEPDIVIMLVGNKLDLVEKQQTLRKVPTETAQKFAETNNLLFVETSAVNMTQVNEAFLNLIQDNQKLKQMREQKEKESLLQATSSNIQQSEKESLSQTTPSNIQQSEKESLLQLTPQKIQQSEQEGLLQITPQKIQQSEQEGLQQITTSKDEVIKEEEHFKA